MLALSVSLSLCVVRIIFDRGAKRARAAAWGGLDGWVEIRAPGAYAIPR